MAELFNPARANDWLAHGRRPEHAALLAEVWTCFPDLPDSEAADRRLARMRERALALRPIMRTMAEEAEAARQTANFAFTEQRVAAGTADERERAIVQARDRHGHDWDRAIRYAAGWYAARAGWEPECRRPGRDTALDQAYDQGFRDGGGNRDDPFDAARRQLALEATPQPEPAQARARPLPSDWPKPDDRPRPTGWCNRLLILGAPEAGIVAADNAPILVSAFEACPGAADATVVVIAATGFHSLASARRLDEPLHIAAGDISLASDPARSAQLRTLLAGRDFDDILVAAQGPYLAAIDAYADALPLCRTMERMRNSALQQRAQFRAWLGRGLSEGVTLGAGHIRWGKAISGLTGRLGEFTARNTGKVPGRGHRFVIEIAGGEPATGFVCSRGEELDWERYVGARARLREAMGTALRAFGGATRLRRA